MAIYKNKDLEVDINVGEAKFISEGAPIYTGDKGSASIRISIKHKKQPFNFNDSDMVPTLDLFHSDGSIWLEEPVNIIVRDYGVIEYNIPENVISHAGKVNVKLFLKNNDISIHVLNFTFEISDSGIEGAVEKEISVKLVEDTIRKIISENALELLDNEFKTAVFDEFKAYTIANPEQFKGERGIDGPQGPRGVQGLTGSQGIQGVKGDKGDKGEDGIDGVRGPQGIQGPKGEKGESAYQTAVKDGFIGTEKDWVQELGKGNIGDLVINFDEYDPDKTGNIDVSFMLQDAFERVKKNGIGTVNISEGEYLINSRVIIYGNTTLNMSDKTILSRGNTNETLMNASYTDTYSEYDGNSNINIIGGIFYSNYNKLAQYPTEAANHINLMHAENIWLKNVTFLDTLSYHAIDANGVKGLRIDNCTFEGYAKLKADISMKESIQLSEYLADSISGSGMYDGTPCKDIFITNCTFKPSNTFGAPDVGIGNHTSAFGMYQSNINVIGNSFIGCTGAGVRPYKWNDFKLENNIFDGCYQALRVSSIGGNDKASQTIEGELTNLPQAGKNYIIKGNILRNCELGGFGFYGQRYNDIEARVDTIIIVDNVLESSVNHAISSEGIRLDLTDNVQIRNNQLTGFSRSINYRYCNNVSISENTFKSCEKEVVFNNNTEHTGIPSVTNIQVNNNHLQDGKYNYIYIQDALNMTVSDNVITSQSENIIGITSRGGIYMKNSNNILTRDNNFNNINREYHIKAENLTNSRYKEETDVFDVMIDGVILS